MYRSSLHRSAAGFVSIVLKFTEDVYTWFIQSYISTTLKLNFLWKQEGIGVRGRLTSPYRHHIPNIYYKVVLKSMQIFDLRRGSNPQPSDVRSDALPIALLRPEALSRVREF